MKFDIVGLCVIILILVCIVGVYALITDFWENDISDNTKEKIRKPFVWLLNKFVEFLFYVACLKRISKKTQFHIDLEDLKNKDLKDIRYAILVENDKDLKHIDPVIQEKYEYRIFEVYKLVVPFLRIYLHIGNQKWSIKNRNVSLLYDLENQRKSVLTVNKFNL